MSDLIENNYQHIEMVSVDSRNIDSIGYCPDTEVLIVRFHRGGRYAYHGVPESEYNALLNAESVGSYHHRNIKNNEEYSAEAI